MLFKYGDENNQMYVVKQGVVYFGGRVVLPGSTFCEESLYKPGMTQGRTAVAFTFTFLYTLKREALHRVVRGYPEVESQFRVKSIRRLFREEVCSYAYAVQALFDQSLYEAVEDTVSNAEVSSRCNCSALVSLWFMGMVVIAAAACGMFGTGVHPCRHGEAAGPDGAPEKPAGDSCR